MSLPDPKAIVLMSDLVLALGVVVLLTIAAVIASYARKKGRTWASFYFISVGVTPLLAGVLVATVPECLHPEEAVSCPECAGRVRFTAQACGACGQKLSPQPELGELILNRARVNTNRIRWSGYVVAAVGLIGVVISLFLSAQDLLKNPLLWELFWVLLGIGIALMLMVPIRRFSASELTKSFGGK